VKKREEKIKTGLYLPEELYIELKKQAAEARMSCSEYVTQILRSHQKSLAEAE
jgi:hypothetical protein